MTEPSGFSVRIFFPSGNPEGLRIIKKSNRLAQGVVFPRSLFVEARNREELRRTGVYILWESGGSGQLPRVYVGESDVLRPRLDSHARSKDFWTHGVAFTSRDRSFNKAHVQYLEARLVQLAAEAKRCELDNGNIPQTPSLSDAETADAEAYLSDILLCLPIMGVSFFETPRKPTRKVQRLYLRGKGIQAEGFEEASGFVVRAGSYAIKDETPSIHTFLSKLRDTLLKKSVLKDAGSSYRFTQDYIFSAPSTAAGVVFGRAANGLIEWKDDGGRSLRELQEARIEAAQASNPDNRNRAVL